MNEITDFEWRILDFFIEDMAAKKRKKRKS